MSNSRGQKRDSNGADHRHWLQIGTGVLAYAHISDVDTRPKSIWDALELKMDDSTKNRATHAIILLCNCRWNTFIGH